MTIIGIAQKTTWFNKLPGKERVSNFLHGLNKDLMKYEDTYLVQSRCLQFREALAEVQREESRQKMMMNFSRSSDPESINQVSPHNAKSSSEYRN